jgi:hypothetical protein
MKLAIALLLLLLFLPADLAARKSHRPRAPRAPKSSLSQPRVSQPRVAKPRKAKPRAVRPPRSSNQRRAFQRGNPCPSTGRTSGRCPGYVVDHVVPLKRGGADHPSNMQWQTKDQAKRKDRIE